VGAGRCRPSQSTDNRWMGNHVCILYRIQDAGPVLEAICPWYMALGLWLRSRHPRLGDCPPSCSGGCSDRCIVHRSEGYLDRNSPESCPRSSPGYSDYNEAGCTLRCSPGYSDHCGPSSSAGCSPRCSRRSSGRCSPNCSVNCSQSCSLRCFAGSGFRRGQRTKLR
jgi:hypothetical protein